MHPVDIIVTKIGRLNQRDIQDIEKCIQEFKISEADIRSIAAQVSPTYVSKQEDYTYHLKWVIEKFFHNNKT